MAEKIKDSEKPEDIDTVETTDQLALYVRSKFWESRNSRSVLDVELLRCLRQRDQKYALDEEINLGTVKSFYPLTSLKCRALEAWITDIYNGAQDKPWILQPTPKPEIPDFVRELIINHVQMELMKYGATAVNIKERMRELVQIAQGYVMDYSKAAAERMSTSIQDDLVELNFNKLLLKDFLPDFSTFPYAVIKGPYIQYEKELSWGKKYTPVVKRVPKYMLKRVSPFDYYFAPYAQKAGDYYEIELMRIMSTELAEYADEPGYMKDNINYICETFGLNGFQEAGTNYYQRQYLEKDATMPLNRGGLLDTLNFWGVVPGYLLTQYGLKVDDPNKGYHVNIWCVAGTPIRCRFNPHPLGKSVYKVTAFEKTPGCIPGTSLPYLIRTHQEVINSAVRALRRNMGLASGPFVEVDAARVEAADVPTEISPMQVKLVNPDITGGGRNAYVFHDINSHAGELEKIIDSEIRRADESSGIPAYSYGNSQTAGAGRTVGGLAILMGNAAKGIKNAILNIDRDIIAPIIEDMFTYKMLYDDDETIKCDAQVQITGLAGVVVKDAAVQKRLEYLNVLTPWAQMGAVGIDGIKILLREIGKPLELPVDKIVPDPEKQKQLQEFANQGPGGPPVAPPGMPVAGAPQGNPLQALLGAAQGAQQPQGGPPQGGGDPRAALAAIQALLQQHNPQGMAPQGAPGAQLPVNIDQRSAPAPQVLQGMR